MSLVIKNNNQLITFYESVSYLQEYMHYLVEYTYNNCNSWAFWILCFCELFLSAVDFLHAIQLKGKS